MFTKTSPELQWNLNYTFSFTIVLNDMLVFKVGMTHSYGNGRRLDDSKALGELDFQVN